MRLLFTLDSKDYDPNGTVRTRPSVRAIICRDGKVAMVRSRKYDYYKFPGGGIEPGETMKQALIRETREEAGLAVLPESIREYGYVHRVMKGEKEDMFVQDNYYYLCRTSPQRLGQQLDDYEAEERFTLEYISPQEAICVNRTHDHGPKSQQMLEREARVLECLMAEGFLSGEKGE